MIEAFSHLDPVLIGLRCATYLGVVLVVGSILLRFSLASRIQKPGAFEKALNGQLLFGLLLVFAASAFTAINLMLSWETGPQMLLEVTSGQALLLRLVACLLIFATLRLKSSLASLLGAFLLALSFGLEGHSRSLEDPSIHTLLLSTLVVLHVALISWWLAVIWPMIRSARLSEASLQNIAEAFGRQAMLAVPVLLVAGLTLLALFYISETGTSLAYLLIVAAKLTCVAALLSIAAKHKLRSVPALRQGGDSAFQSLAFSLKAEGLIALAILALTATLTGLGLE